MPNPKYAAYEAAKPYFDLVRGALATSLQAIGGFFG
jgi:hypothetical protein